MKQMLTILRTTLVGGLLFLVPIVVLTIIIEKAIELAHKIATPLAEKLFPAQVLGFRTELLLAIGVIVLFCLLAGLFARTVIAKKFVAWLEDSVLSHIPGYVFFKGVGKSLLGGEDESDWEVVLVRFPEAMRVGFIVDKLENHLMAVFLPGSPDVHTGEVLFMPADRVTMLPIKPHAILKCLKRMGAGSTALLEGVALSQGDHK